MSDSNQLGESVEPERRSRRRLVLTWLLGVLAAIALFGLALSGVALWQLRSMTPTTSTLDLSPQDEELEDANPALPPIELRLELSTVQWILLPAASGEPFTIETSYDPEHYTLEQSEAPRLTADGGRLIELHFSPMTPALAFMRMKLGETLPKLEVRVPSDQPLIVKGAIRSSFAAIEAGGLTLDAFDLTVGGGAATVSFLEPTTRPMKVFVLEGDAGSVEVTGLGHASPAQVRVAHRLGEIDLDFRGEWRNDSVIDLRVQFAGGALWLPRDVVTRGLGDSSPTVTLEPAEGSRGRPELSISLEQSAGRLVVVQ